MQNLLLSTHIKEQCKQRHLSVKSLLEQCDMNRNTIYDLEKKGAFPASDKLSRIADYLDCSVDYLLGRVDTPDLPKASIPAAPALSADEERLLDMYRQLDIDDRAEIRVEAKSLLKAAKYTEKHAHSTHVQIAAFGQPVTHLDIDLSPEEIQAIIDTMDKEE